MSRDSRIVLGCKAKDKITGLTGIVYAITDWLNGCRRISIQPQELKDGKPVEGSVFDVEQVEFVEEAASNLIEKPTGGPPMQASRPADPK